MYFDGSLGPFWLS